MGELFEFEELASKPSCVILSHLEWKYLLKAPRKR